MSQAVWENTKLNFLKGKKKIIALRGTLMFINSKIKNILL